MARVKKVRTPEQIEADRERMARVRAARENKNLETNPEEKEFAYIEEKQEVIEEQPAEEVVEEIPVLEEPEKPDVTISQQDFDDMKRQIEELKNLPWKILGQLAPQETAKVANGQLTGTVEKYPLIADLYPNPTERLSEEQKLQRFAFKINYELNFEVGESRYETIDHVRTVEPKFTLELIRKVMDDEGNDSGGRYVLGTLIFHEDPTAAITIARSLNMDIDESNEQEFLNEMRYIRMRDWLISRFYPSRIEDKKQRRDVVIDGKLVQFFEVNSESGGVGADNWGKISEHKL